MRNLEHVTDDTASAVLRPLHAIISQHRLKLSLHNCALEGKPYGECGTCNAWEVADAYLDDYAYRNAKSLRQVGSARVKL